MESTNTSGHGEFSKVPLEIKKWNWGAFWFSWIWGIFNKSYISLLALIPIVSFIMPFYLGAKGNELAWRNNYWIDINEFNLYQKKWAKAGWIFAACIVLIITFQISDAYKRDKQNSLITNQVISIINKNEEVKALVGNEFKIEGKPSFEGAITSSDSFPLNHRIFLKGINGIIMVFTSMDEKHNIKKITVSTFYNDQKIYIDVNGD